MADRARRGPPQDLRYQGLACSWREQFRVAQTGRYAPGGLVDHDDARGDRPAERAAADLVATGDPRVALGEVGAFHAQGG